MEVLNSILFFIVAIGILVTVHEMGHFLVAKNLGVKVLRFSVGFGRPLWRRQAGEDATEYVVAAIPLGGYVKMLDEREGEVGESELPRAFNRQPLWKRVAIVVAGPAANFAFAILAYWIMFIIGIGGLRSVVDEVSPGSLAEAAGLRVGDEIVAVAGRRTVTWERVIQMITSKSLEGYEISLEVENTGSERRMLELNLAEGVLDEIAAKGFFKQMGIQPRRPMIPPVIGRLEAGAPAEQAGFMPGDRIVAADGQYMDDWQAWVTYVREHGETVIHVELTRDEVDVSLEVRPELVEGDDGMMGRIGAAVAIPDNGSDDFYAVERYSPLVAVGKALSKTQEVSLLTLRMVWKMVLQEVSVKNLSGPLSIAQYAGYSAKVGVARFLEFLAIVSVSLGILNLFPIPLLDGGHLMYYLMEFLRGEPVSETVQALGQRVGLAMLMGLMGLAFFNDIVRLLG
ncbi:MAG: RIP metalloprotease RseP [Gammaproteobacteria bacterium]|nr:RIP metalloprotease RseP [Gammaproteobacteria bacterium]